eukprot:1189158-Rhodomonas_salina.1
MHTLPISLCTPTAPKHTLRPSPMHTLPMHSLPMHTLSMHTFPMHILHAAPMHTFTLALALCTPDTLALCTPTRALCTPTPEPYAHPTWLYARASTNAVYLTLRPDVISPYEQPYAPAGSALVYHPTRWLY